MAGRKAERKIEGWGGSGVTARERKKNAELRVRGSP
ncbi:unnamed protein product, partial [Ixodes pacificus]